MADVTAGTGEFEFQIYCYRKMLAWWTRLRNSKQRPLFFQSWKLTKDLELSVKCQFADCTGKSQFSSVQFRTYEINIFHRLIPLWIGLLIPYPYGQSPCFLVSDHTAKNRTVFSGKILKTFNPFTPESDQFQISPAASPEILHHTVWRTWLFIAYSDERWLYYQFSLPHLYIFSIKG